MLAEAGFTKRKSADGAAWAKPWRSPPARRAASSRRRRSARRRRGRRRRISTREPEQPQQQQCVVYLRLAGTAAHCVYESAVNESVVEADFEAQQPQILAGVRKPPSSAASTTADNPVRKNLAALLNGSRARLAEPEPGEQRRRREPPRGHDRVQQQKETQFRL